MQENVTTQKKKHKEKPGNAQNLETPKVIEPLDFTKVKVNELMLPDHEHYFMNQAGMNIDCQTCTLLLDYTTVCSHCKDNSGAQINWENFEEKMKTKTNQVNIVEKMEALRGVMSTIDKLSTLKESSIAILRGQFSEVVVMFLRKDLNSLLGDNSELAC